MSIERVVIQRLEVPGHRRVSPNLATQQEGNEGVLTEGAEDEQEQGGVHPSRTPITPWAEGGGGCRRGGGRALRGMETARSEERRVWSSGSRRNSAEEGAENAETLRSLRGRDRLAATLGAGHPPPCPQACNTAGPPRAEQQARMLLEVMILLLLYGSPLLT